MSVSATHKILCLHLEMWWTVIVNVTSLLYLDRSADCVLNVSTKLTKTLGRSNLVSYCFELIVDFVKKIFKIYLLFI